MHFRQDFPPRIARISRMANPAFLIRGIGEICGFSSSVAASPLLGGCAFATLRLIPRSLLAAS
jgi:hypothetical protein